MVAKTQVDKTAPVSEDVSPAVEKDVCEGCADLEKRVTVLESLVSPGSIPIPLTDSKDD